MKPWGATTQRTSTAPAGGARRARAAQRALVHAGVAPSTDVPRRRRRDGRGDRRPDRRGAHRDAAEGTRRCRDPGNLAPEGCVVKLAGHDRTEHRGPARVRLRGGLLRGGEGRRDRPGDVVVIRYEGPAGGPGMREMLHVTGAIVGEGLRTRSHSSRTGGSRVRRTDSWSGTSRPRRFAARLRRSRKVTRSCSTSTPASCESSSPTTSSPPAYATGRRRSRVTRAASREVRGARLLGVRRCGYAVGEIEADRRTTSTGGPERHEDASRSERHLAQSGRQARPRMTAELRARRCTRCPRDLDRAWTGMRSGSP